MDGRWCQVNVADINDALSFSYFTVKIYLTFLALLKQTKRGTSMLVYGLCTVHNALYG